MIKREKGPVRVEFVSLADVQAEAAPRCPTCREHMRQYGGSMGYVCCGWKMLYRHGGWVDEDGRHVKDDRLAGGKRRVDGEVVA